MSGVLNHGPVAGAEHCGSRDRRGPLPAPRLLHGGPVGQRTLWLLPSRFCLGSGPHVYDPLHVYLCNAGSKPCDPFAGQQALHS
eukprot:5676198-Alexandrium_andersonii.AAC.1